jgi:adenylate kinase
MKNIIFIAPPAAGKGTQSDLLVNKYGYAHISTGDLLRAEVAAKTDLGIKISDIMQSGALVSDDIVSELLTNALSSLNGPFILDGYPRTIEQAKILEDILNKLNKKIESVIYLNVPEDVATKRATGRLSCPKCNKTYHKYFAKPIKDGICDACGTALISRSDDTEETFKVRFTNYMKNTAPLLDYYKNLGLLTVIDKIDTPEETLEEIEKVIK